MKKRLLLLFMSFSISIGFIPSVISAEEKNDFCFDCLNNGTDYDYFIEYDEKGDIKKLEVIVVNDPNSPPVQTRGIFTAIVTIVYGVCSGQNYGGFNPCTELVKIVYKETGTQKAVNDWLKRQNGKSFNVTKKDVWGKIPNCNPPHAQTCTGWYSVYTYTPK